MTDKLIISVEDIQRFRPVSAAQDRLNSFIREAQVNDLRPILGDPLYYDFLKRFDVSADSMYNVYQELLLGKEYTYNNITYVYDGLAGLLSYFALARLRANPIEDTKFGPVSKLNGDKSERPSAEDIRQSINELKSIGASCQERLTQFLRAKQSTYPLYQYANADADMNKGGGVKWFDPDTMNYNNLASQQSRTI